MPEANEGLPDNNHPSAVVKTRMDEDRGCSGSICGCFYEPEVLFLWVSSQEEPYYFESLLGPPDFWKLPYKPNQLPASSSGVLLN